MKTVNIHEAKTNMSRLLQSVAQGQSVTIANAGKPVAQLTPIGGIAKRRFGTLRGKYPVPDDIDTPFAKDIEEMFYGNSDYEKPVKSK